MKNFKFFKELKDYREFIYTDIFRTPEFREDPFYRGLIEFVIEHRAPIFFSQDYEEEFSHFTQYFNAVLDRGDYYQNDFVRSMYFAHDFTHMLFQNPLRPRDLSFNHFCEILNNNEWVASNETETFTYFRISNMREKSLPYTIMYDLLQHVGKKNIPSVKEMLTIRKNIFDGGNESWLAGHPDAEIVFDFLRKFKENNAVWCKLWYENFPDIEALYIENRMTLPVLEYDTILPAYTTSIHFSDAQARYEYNVFQNVRTLALLAGLDPEFIPNGFSDCEHTLAQLEGKVIMHDVAKHFHFTYIKNKNRGTGKK